eukprot:CAMPEP_0170603598 /NCGR_PEP_ID=MMETSP0224-20130122/18995_1 /TAXON_ID=285029 /ORGANISM="Togula jolla, Strain CCCM 725" /LENGTH=56 /DNA_ID=CAMNT_0010928485 /DNA_START=710 /DNA_END=880 /DNA_ORIENTATION=+
MSSIPMGAIPKRDLVFKVEHHHCGHKVGAGILKPHDLNPLPLAHVQVDPARSHEGC